MTRVALVALSTRAAAFVFAAGACSCTPGAQSCAVSFFADAASHVTSTIPLNTQAGCAGYSTVPLAGDPQAVEGPQVCAADVDDGACVACLRVACCGIVGQTCVALDAATCAAVPEVDACIKGALLGTCDTACPGPQ